MFFLPLCNWVWHPCWKAHGVWHILTHTLTHSPHSCRFLSYIYCRNISFLCAAVSFALSWAASCVVQLKDMWWWRQGRTWCIRLLMIKVLVWGRTPCTLKLWSHIYACFIHAYELCSCFFVWLSSSRWPLGGRPAASWLEGHRLKRAPAVPLQSPYCPSHKWEQFDDITSGEPTVPLPLTSGIVLMSHAARNSLLLSLSPSASLSWFHLLYVPALFQSHSWIAL